MTLPIALDAMGGDNAPADLVAGAHIAAERGVLVTLVGDEAKLSQLTDLNIVHASEVIEMGDEPASSVRSKKDSSMVVAAKLVSDGEASAVVSAGNTGAALAASLLKLGRIKGVTRPTIAVPFPTAIETPTILVDTGANADCQAAWLVQFGKLGAIYARRRFGIEVPKVAMLTIGEEAGKGNALIKETCALAEETDFGAIGAKYVGNIEGHDFLTGVADVVIADGFTGNIVLKSLEGMYDMYADKLAEAFEGDESALSKLAPVMRRYDPVQVGTGVLLGLKHVSMIAHGSSTPEAIANACSTANELVELDIVGVQRSELVGDN